jgi:GAF domain-containing protein
MAAWIRQIFAPPVFQDEEQTRIARLLNVVLWTLVATMLVAFVTVGLFYGLPQTSDELFTVGSTILMLLLSLGFLSLARRGHVRLVSAALLLAIWAVMTFWIFSAAGIKSDTSPMVYPLIVVLAALLLGGPAALAFALLCVLAAFGAYYAERIGWLVVPSTPVTMMDPFMAAISLLLTGSLLYYAVDNMLRALDRAQTNERAQIAANRELEAMRASLEQRVADRTRDLERHSLHLQAAVEVGRAATSELNPEELMWQVAELIRERFELYHVGLFQVDTGGQWAQYRAGSGAGAALLADEGFRLKVGGESMVGWCTAHAQARITQDISRETVRYDHPEVPDTRSEIALPLIARGQILGALSAQSEQLDAFDSQTVASLQSIADQVAVTLDNLRLFAETQEALRATRRAYSELSRDAWTDLLRSRANLGYIYTGYNVALATGKWQPEMVEARRTGSVVHGRDGNAPVLAIPLQVRDQVIGVLGFSKGEPDQTWTAEETELLEALSHQLEVALEGARLFEETQRRAAREQAIRQVTEHMRRAVDVEAILQNAVTELAHVLGAPRAYVRLGTDLDLEAGEEPGGQAIGQAGRFPQDNGGQDHVGRERAVSAGALQDAHSAP